MLAVRPPAAAPRPKLPTVLEEFSDASETALRESAELFSELASLLRLKRLPDEDQLLRWKEKAKQINQQVSRSTRLCWAELDRMKVDSDTTVIAAKHDALDERANAARVIEKVRTFCNVQEGSVDRAVASTMQVQNLLASLCACPETQFHGAHALHRDVETNADGLDAVFLT